jgi:hypothetical protein
LLKATVTRGILPLLISLPILLVLLRVTGADPFQSTEVALRNLGLPTLIVVVLWNAFAVIGRAWIDRNQERRKVDHGA